jgi:hypothetical protein
MDSADYILFAATSFVVSLVCFASPVFGWIWRGDWAWPGWTIGSLLRSGRSKSAFRTNAIGPVFGAISEPSFSDPMARYSIGWVFLALALVLLVAAGLDAV